MSRNQAVSQIALVLAKLETETILSFAEIRLVVTALRGLTGYIDEYVFVSGEKKRKRKKISFFVAAGFDHSEANAIFDYRHRGLDGVPPVDLIRAFNFARCRLASIQAVRKEQAREQRTIGEYIDWMREAIRLQAELRETYDPLAEQEARKYAFNYRERGITFEELVGPARDGIIAGINTFNPVRVVYDFERLIRSHLSKRIKSKVENDWIRKRLKRREVVASQISTDDTDYFDSVSVRQNTEIPTWLVDLLLPEKGSSFEEAFRRSLILRTALERRQRKEDSIFTKISSEQVHIQATDIRNKGRDAKIELGESEGIPREWRTSWLRLLMQRHLLDVHLSKR